jgi:hypothetical protein
LDDLGRVLPRKSIPDVPILVTGAHRTGTTWVGKMLAASGEAAYISEPLNVLHRPGVFRAPVKYWYPYICQENEHEYLTAFQELLTFHYHTWAELKSLSSRKDLLRMGRDRWIFLQSRIRSSVALNPQRPLLKDPFAVFSIPWFIQRLGCQVVVTVRHPAAFASSLKRLSWPFQFNDLLDQPLLMRDWLEPYRKNIEDLLDEERGAGSADIIAQGSLLWCMIYAVVTNLKKLFPQIQIVRHEDLSLDPVDGYRSLYEVLGLRYSTRAQTTILEASSSDNPKEVSRQDAFAVRLDSRANLHHWKRRLSPEEIQRIRLLTENIASEYYPELTWD